MTWHCAWDIASAAHLRQTRHHRASCAGDDHFRATLSCSCRHSFVSTHVFDQSRSHWSASASGVPERKQNQQLAGYSNDNWVVNCNSVLDSFLLCGHAACWSHRDCDVAQMRHQLIHCQLPLSRHLLHPLQSKNNVNSLFSCLCPDHLALN